MAGRPRVGMTFGTGSGLPLLAALALAACAWAPTAEDAAEAGPAAVTDDLGAADVEAPELFQVTDQGLWDGRPSLGGTWVAHPDVGDPERVIVRNGDNGRSVIGALFRRERANPGPAIQVSSDAAEALGMLAGAPASLSVTALRRGEAPAPVPGEAAAPADAPGDAAPADPAESVAAVAASIVAEGAAAPDDAAAPAAGLDLPFLQLGLFAREANADEAAAALAAEGLPARVAPSETQGEGTWRVLVGPAATEAERADLLDRVRAEGFADAFPVQS